MSLTLKKHLAFSVSSKNLSSLKTLLTSLSQKRGMIDLSYPEYSRSERIANGVVHVTGIVGAIIGVTILFTFWAAQMDGVTLLSTIIYSAALILILTASSVYHMAAHYPDPPDPQAD